MSLSLYLRDSRRRRGATGCPFGALLLSRVSSRLGPDPPLGKRLLPLRKRPVLNRSYDDVIVKETKRKSLLKE